VVWTAVDCSPCVVISPVDGVTPQGVIADQRQWSVQECATVFARSISDLQADLASRGDGGMLVWDKVLTQHPISFFLILLMYL